MGSQAERKHKLALSMTGLTMEEDAILGEISDGRSIPLA
jgi:hypothetical protein